MGVITRKFKNIPITAKVSLAYAICNIVQKGLAFFTLPLFTRILTTEQYGQYSIYSSWSGILTIFISLNLPYGSFSTAMVKFEDKRDEYIASVQGICTVFALIFLIMYLPFSRFFNKLFELPTALVVLMIFEILMNTCILCWNGKLRFLYKYKAVIGITLLMSFLSPILALLLIMNTEEKGYARIVGYASVVIIIGGFFYIYNFVKGKKFFNREFWKYALAFNVPLIGYYLSQVIFNQSDRIMISHYCGTDKAGIYSVAYTLSTLLVFVINSINSAYVPWFYGKIKEQKESENKRIANKISVLMAALLLGIICLAPEIIMLLAGRTYYEAIWIVPPVTMSVLLLFYSQQFINVLFYYEKKGSLVWASIGSAVINIVLNALLIPELGYIVAGYTTFFSYVVFVIMNYFSMKKVLAEIGEEFDAFDVKSLVAIFIGFSLLSFAAMGLYACR